MCVCDVATVIVTNSSSPYNDPDNMYNEGQQPYSAMSAAGGGGTGGCSGYFNTDSGARLNTIPSTDSRHASNSGINWRSSFRFWL